MLVPEKHIVYGACRSVAGGPLYRNGWALPSGIGCDSYCIWLPVPQADQGPYAQHTAAAVHSQWTQELLLQLLHALHPLLVQLGLSTPAEFSTQPGTVAGAAAAAGIGGQPSTADAGSSSGIHGAAAVRWGYLLQQLKQSRGWAEAAAAFGSNWPDALRVLNAALRPSSEESGAISDSGSQHQQQQQQQGLDDISQLYADALQLCRALVAAAPLPLVCNNPSCDNLAGVSETAVATKLCAGCRCRYCSAACADADWRRHRKGCKAMAAAGLAAR
jgi:hypothetical protein